MLHGGKTHSQYCLSLFTYKLSTVTQFDSLTHSKKKYRSHRTHCRELANLNGFGTGGSRTNALMWAGSRATINDVNVTAIGQADSR
jgi:hypothetical protein